MESRTWNIFTKTLNLFLSEKPRKNFSPNISPNALDMTIQFTVWKIIGAFNFFLMKILFLKRNAFAVFCVHVKSINF